MWEKKSFSWTRESFHFTWNTEIANVRGWKDPIFLWLYNSSGSTVSYVGLQYNHDYAATIVLCTASFLVFELYCNRNFKKKNQAYGVYLYCTIYSVGPTSILWPVELLAVELTVDQPYLYTCFTPFCHRRGRVLISSEAFPFPIFSHRRRQWILASSPVAICAWLDLTWLGRCCCFTITFIVKWNLRELLETILSHHIYHFRKSYERSARLEHHTVPTIFVYKHLSNHQTPSFGTVKAKHCTFKQNKNATFDDGSADRTLRCASVDSDRFSYICPHYTIQNFIWNFGGIWFISRCHGDGPSSYFSHDGANQRSFSRIDFLRLTIGCVFVCTGSIRV